LKSQSVTRKVGQIRTRFLVVAVLMTVLLPFMVYARPLNSTVSVTTPIARFIPKIIPLEVLTPQPTLRDELAKGKLLVASKQIKGSLFAESVVLLLDYGSHGATGLIINKPTSVKISSVLPDVKGLQDKPDTLYLGGPVSENQIIMLIRSERKHEEAIHIFENVYFSFSKSLLQNMIDEENEGEGFHLFAGYSGWASGQLEREILRGDWYVMEGEGGIVFNQYPHRIWDELIRKFSLYWARLHRL
jgi:putative transcriptional regulator